MGEFHSLVYCKPTTYDEKPLKTGGHGSGEVFCTFAKMQAVCHVPSARLTFRVPRDGKMRRWQHVSRWGCSRSNQEILVLCWKTKNIQKLIHQSFSWHRGFRLGTQKLENTNPDRLKTPKILSGRAAELSQVLKNELFLNWKKWNPCCFHGMTISSISMFAQKWTLDDSTPCLQ